jgi:hypothetical protein
LIIYCLVSIEGLINNQPAWYRNDVQFSDWRNIKKVDYSTNAVVANWYSGGHSQYFRPALLKDITGKLDAGDTLTIGLDYYIFTPASLQLSLQYFSSGANSLRLENGEVIIIKMWKENNLIHFNEFKN